MEHNLFFLENGRQHQIFSKKKTTSIFELMEDVLNNFPNGRRHHFCGKMEESQLYEKGRRPQFLVRRPKYFGKWKMTQYFSQWKIN